LGVLHDRGGGPAVNCRSLAATGPRTNRLRRFRARSWPGRQPAACRDLSGRRCSARRAGPAAA